MRRAIVASIVVAASASATGLALGGSQETVSWTVRPTVVRYFQDVTASGLVGSGRPEQLVTIQSRPCDQPTWRDLAETTTRDGGAWSVDFQPAISGLFRAVSAGAVSEPVKILQRPYVYFTQRPANRFRAGVQTQRPYWHSTLTIERFDGRRRVWKAVKKVLLTVTESEPGQSYVYSGSEPFRIDVPKGTSLRASFPLAQARPCYLGGASAIIRR